MKHSKEASITAWFLILLLAIIWGSSFILMKRGLVAFSYDELAAIRMISAMLVVMPFVIVQFKRIPVDKLKYMALSGVMGNLLPAFLFPIAQTMVASSMAGLLNSLTPVFVLVLGKFFFGVKTKRQAVYGVALGLIGAITLILIRTQGAIGSNPFYGLYIVLACLCYATSVNVIRTHLADVSPVIITGVALLFAGVPCCMFFFDETFVQKLSMDRNSFSLSAIVLLGTLGSGLSTVLFNKLVKITTALSASSVTYLIPIVAMLWGLWDHESVGFMHLAAITGILGGVYLINKK